jgi:large subunit ribosomal protein L2
MLSNKIMQESNSITKSSFKKRIKKKKFRNSSGNLVFYHRSYGHKKKYRTNFIQDFEFKSGVVIDYQYDPYKNSPTCLVFTEGKKFILIPCIEDVKIGTLVQFKTKKFSNGNYSSLKYIPVNSVISFLWNNLSKRFIYSRSAGSFSILLSKTSKYALIKLKSGSLQIVSLNFFCFFGKVACWNFNKKRIYRKAGRNKWLGIRPTVRGVAMNPIDHPHGGGEGKTSGGRCSVSPWGKLTKGVPTVNTGLNRYLKNKLIRKYF